MIYINEKLRIRKLDTRSLQLEEYREAEDCNLTKEKGHKWRWCGYYGDLKSACLGALSKQLFDSVKNEMDLNAVIVAIDNARADIIKAIEAAGNLK